MEKRISFNEFQSVKSVAKAIDPIIRKRESVKNKIEALVEEYKGYETQIKALEAGIVTIIGFHVEDLVKKVIEPDAHGNKVTKYLPTDIVSYDNQTKQYVITTPDEGANTTTASTEEPSTVTEAPVEEVPTAEEPETEAEPAEENTEDPNMPWD